MALSPFLRNKLRGAFVRARRLAPERIELNSESGQCYIDTDAVPAGEGIVTGFDEERESVVVVILKEEWSFTPVPGMQFELPDYTDAVFEIVPAELISTETEWRLAGVEVDA